MSKDLGTEEKRIPIDFHAIAEETGVKKGKVCYSPTFGWGVEGHPTVDFCLIDPPYKEGDEFDGGVVEGVRIENNEWVLRIRKPKDQ